jgi:hypothetical protein
MLTQMGDIRGTIEGNALKFYKIQAEWSRRMTRNRLGDFFLIY